MLPDVRREFPAPIVPVPDRSGTQDTAQRSPRTRTAARRRGEVLADGSPRSGRIAEYGCPLRREHRARGERWASSSLDRIDERSRGAGGQERESCHDDGTPGNRTTPCCFRHELRHPFWCSDVAPSLPPRYNRQRLEADSGRSKLGFFNGVKFHKLELADCRSRRPD